MFDFIRDAGNYELRMVGRYEAPDDELFFISTASVSDSTQPFETAVAHPQYNDGKIVIVEQYDTREEALKGHMKWVTLMTIRALPESLTDVSTSAISQLCASVGWEGDERVSVRRDV